VVKARKAHKAWGGRKLRRWLLRQGYGDEVLPAPSTITEILRRHGLLCPEACASHRPCQRFEHERPNALWQMDFKGHFPTRTGRCHPFTVLDDHSRYALGLRACGNEREDTVQAALTALFDRYGLPERILADNGSPWGTGGGGPYTALGVWLLRLGVGVVHARPYHPQTLGKDERFHRTLKVELLAGRDFLDLEACQRAFDPWRHVYNHERPHEALDLDVPASRYRPSPRAFPEPLPPIEYDDKLVRKVQAKGKVHLGGRAYRVPAALRGYPVALRPTLSDGLLDVYFCAHKVAQIALSDHDGAS
jgi:transposase InsO family protein